MNNPLYISKSLLKSNNTVDKKVEFLTEILIGLKLDEDISFPYYSKDIFKNQDIKI